MAFALVSLAVSLVAIGAVIATRRTLRKARNELRVAADIVVFERKEFNALRERLIEADLIAKKARKDARHAKAEAQARHRAMDAEAATRAEERLQRCIGKTVIVHTRQEHSIEGVLLALYSDTVVIRHARYLMNEQDAELLNGDQIIPRGNVEWIQELVDVARSQNG